MMRVARQLNYLLMSSTMLLTSQQEIINYKPFIIEPSKQYFPEPVAVFDFQSLYPSIMIAHNICYSTCLGKIDAKLLENGETQIGFLSNNLSFQNLKIEDIFVLHNNTAFVKKHIRKGVLPKMLEEFLQTRIFLKKSIKDIDAEFRIKLENQQKSLKLFMNTTFGYTGAGFTGHMPMVELAEAVVSTARQIVHQSIELISSINKDYQVIYGDTDSIFVLMKEHTINQSFEAIDKILEKITSSLPYPIDLKFEKIYQPSIYYSKKRYCGYKYENKQSQPVLEAKGIEVIRRDSCKIVQKLLTDFTLDLFTNQNLSLIKCKLENFCLEAVNNNVDFSNFIVNKKYRSRDSKIESIPQKINNRLITADPMNYFLNKERVQYFIIESGLTTKLKETVR